MTKRTRATFKPEFTLTPKSSNEFKGGLCAPFTPPATPGMTVTNAIRNHQINSNTFPTRGISTTTDFNVACMYAASNRYIAVIDRDNLKSHYIAEYIVKDHLYLSDVKETEDSEVILVSENNGIYPKEIIYEIVTL
ncbi:MAG: hypothetical protein OEM38_08180 [Gammaproteobacteria bacterium]|nr:hypothetical protein [Gammaproteobacteria bacterium]